MSDYIPPGTATHINQMPEECLRLLFIRLPLKDQFNAGHVCQLWRTIRNALFLTQKSLTIKIGRSRTNATSDLIIAELSKESIETVVELLPSISQLTIYSTDVSPFEASSQVAHLLSQYREKLDTLGYFGKFHDFNFSINGAIFFDAINAMSKLKQLTLHFDFGWTCKLAPFDLPILRQLDKFDFECRQMPATIVTLWAPHLEARSTPMEISFACSSDYFQTARTFYDSITPKVASMFTQFPTFHCGLQQFRRLSTRFTNLTQLSLDDYGEGTTRYTLAALLKALVNLKQLTTLCINTFSVSPVGGQQGGGHLPQLPTVKKWHLYVNLCFDGKPYSHSHVSSWTANLGCIFPNLEDLDITLNTYIRCADCEGTAAQSEDSDYETLGMLEYWKETFFLAKGCLRRQLHLIKQQQCPNLNKAHIRSSNWVSCSFDDLDD